MSKPRSLRTAIALPVLFSLVLAVCDVFARVLVRDYDGVAAIWLLPMCFLFVAQTHLALVARIEALEAQGKQAQTK